MTTISSPVIVAKKPLWRGRVHALMTPLAVITAAFLAVHSQYLWVTVLFGFNAAFLFATSAVYHIGSWSPRTTLILKRIDHSNIFFLMGTTYTPFVTTLLTGRTQMVALIAVWSATMLGVAFKVFFPNAPRAVSAPIYLVTSWATLALMPTFWAVCGPWPVVMLLVGGVFYTWGALIYARQRPNPIPDKFGFHEVFHLFTILGFAAHAVAIYLVVC